MFVKKYNALISHACEKVQRFKNWHIVILSKVIWRLVLKSKIRTQSVFIEYYHNNKKTCFQYGHYEFSCLTHVWDKI